MGIRSFFSRRFASCGNRGGWIVHRIACKLKLDSAQKGRLQSVRASLDTLRNEVQESLAHQREALFEILRSDRFDRHEVLRLSSEPIGTVNAALPVLVERFADFYEGLSADQRNRLRDMIARRGCRRHGCS